MAETVGTCPLTRGRRILVAVDGSEYAEHAINQAISLGRICKSEIFVLSVAEIDAEYLADAPALYERLQKEAGKTAESAKAQVEQAGLSCMALTMTNMYPARAILDVARNREIDLIVMGHRGRSRLKQLILGSVAQHVVAQAPCPVMIVPV